MSVPPEESDRGAPARCPICNRQAGSGRFAPFCSRRCADIDLGRWLKGGYAIPGTPAGDAPDIEAGSSPESLEKD